MTTEHTQPENNDTQVSAVEDSFASNGEPFDRQPANQPDALRATASQSDRLQGTDSPATSDSTELATGAINRAPTQEHDTQVPEAYSPGIPTPEMTAKTTASETGARELKRAPQAPLRAPTEEEAVRPFTSYIEEFRLAEERLGAFQQDQQEPTRTTQASPPPILTTPTPTDEGEKEERAKETPTQEETPVITPTIPAERPVSPLLRPPTRIRMPRHGGGRQREAFAAQNAARAAKETAVAQASAPIRPANDAAGYAEASSFAQAGREENAGVDEPTKTEMPTETVQSIEPIAEAGQSEQQEQLRPARRYRFDRPSAQPLQPSQPPAVTFTPTKAAPVASSPSSPARIEESSAPIRPANNYEDAINRVPTAGRKEKESAQPKPAASKTTEQKSSQAAASTGSSAATTENESPATPVQTQDRRRRHGQERQRAKTQPGVINQAPTPAVPATPAVDEATPVAEPGVPAASETPVEDLPPLEYSELQAASSRRRRRRRANGSTSTPGAALTKPTTPEQPAAEGPGAINRAPTPLTPGAPTTPARGVVVPGSPYTIQSGFTVSQMNQGSDVKGPFMGPEPSPARGSISSTPSRTVRPIRNGNETQRTATPGYPAVRPVEGVVSPGSINHLANVIAQAIQTQGDRMIAELRHANQAPTNISVALPPFPSTERVGVFVDVANLLYSARTLRMTIDFGKLLDFLRGNRRLVRAHAYCPTSPQPGDDQMFLQAVKGLGYRITTKNYKTFASGAKKADMDLDLCMDVVRLVDGNAVDCIVLVSGDSDFMPMLDYCSDHGVRVEVAAFDESMSATLRQSCDLFVNLSMLEEIRV